MPQLDAATFVEQHIARFNQSVETGDFEPLIRQFADDATMRFENVPGAGTLEYSGLAAIRQAYTSSPPDDQIEALGEPDEDGDVVAVRFAWRRTGDTGTMHIRRSGDRITTLDVIFDEAT